jgi:hypothetical protein
VDLVYEYCYSESLVCPGIPVALLNDLPGRVHYLVPALGVAHIHVGQGVTPDDLHYVYGRPYIYMDAFDV